MKVSFECTNYTYELTNCTYEVMKGNLNDYFLF